MRCFMARKTFFKTGQELVKLAYLAGIIDGEGCFYIGHIRQGKYGTRQQWHAKIQISSCDKVLIDWLREHFTGCSQNQYRWTSKKAFYRAVYHWSIGGEALDYFLPLLEPFLIIKNKHCKVMMEIRKTFRNRGSQRLSKEDLELRTNLLKKMRRLNSRFHNHALKQ